jgi:hypothetical protein
VDRPAPVVRVWPVLIALIATAGCNDRLIHLGDGRTIGDAGSDAGGSCPHAEVQADEVLWTGDSWNLIPGIQHTRVRDLARLAGGIGPNDDYVIVAVAGASMAAVAAQYDTQEAGSTKVKVLIMNGGAWDLILANGSDASVASVVGTFRQHLGKVASDGTVEHVVYLLLPELPGLPGIAALRAPMLQVCADSAVPCHFIDLQPLWSGHPEYTIPTGIFATDLGATVAADAIWAVMRQYCIAQ